MKKIFVLFAISFLPGLVFSQTSFYLSGKVIDAVTKTPLQAASVFAQNTTIGTASGADGAFRIDLPNGGYDLVVTFTGYQTETRRISTSDATDKNLVIELRQKEKEMQDVIVKNTYEVKDGWEKYGDFFLDNFIGRSVNAGQCSIRNPTVLRFFFYKKRNKLKVISTEPVEIVNNALGYMIRYALDSFTHDYNAQASLYSGYPLFEEMHPANEAEKGRWDSSRMHAYSGSILHFMRSLYQKRLREEGFEIQFLTHVNDRETAIPVKDFYGGMNYEKDDSTGIVEVLPNQKDVAVIYKKTGPSPVYLAANPEASDKFQLSVLSFFPKEKISIEQNGYYFDQNLITVNQYMGWEKAGDMVPYDFIPLR